jgi:spermidine synthase
VALTPAPTSTPAPDHRPVLFSTLFFLSGLAGLVYEVCWTRLLRLPLGNTLHSMTAVLTAFMAGLALGAWLAGRWIDRRGNPLRTYALLEAAIGVVCFLLPWMVAAWEPVFRWAYRGAEGTALPFNLLRFVACAFVVLVPATLMGATLPVLCRYFIDRTGRLGATVGWLYAVNAFGAATGSLLAGFVLVPQLGLRGAMWTGVATSLFVATLAWLGQRGAIARAASSATPGVPDVGLAGAPVAAHAQIQDVESPQRFVRRILLFGYGISGLAAMVLQIAWARALALLLGSSVYAFALLVSAFILGLALGSAVAGRIADRLRRPALGFAVAEIAIGLTALAMVPVLQRYPEWMRHLVPQLAPDFSRFQFAQFGLVFATLILPTAFMGACLPFVGRALSPAFERAAETVARAYSVNAVGTILGAFLGGFVLLPLLGMHRAILVAAALVVGVGAAVVLVVLRGRTALSAAALVVATGAIAVALVPPFDATTMTSGMYLYADRVAQTIKPGMDLHQYMSDEYQILLHDEGPNVTVTVRETAGGQRILVMNGKSDASDGGDMPTQQLVAHVPCLLHPEPRDVAVVGLASGVSVHSVGLHPTVRAIDCIEIAPEVVPATRLFEHVNGRVLEDPRLRLIFQDARSHMALSGREYDVIVSEPTNPWIAGVANLFTREFVQACHDRLRPGGVLCQWVQLYGLDEHALRSVARTFQDVFPDATLWEAVFAADLLLVGRKPGGESPGSASSGGDPRPGSGPIDRADRLETRMNVPAVAADLRGIGMRSAADLVVRNLADAPRLRDFASRGEIYRDDHNRLEFAAPRLMHQLTKMETIDHIQALRQPGWPSWLTPPANAESEARLGVAQEAQRVFFAGITAKARNDPSMATDRFLTALERNPGTHDVWPRLLDVTREVVPNSLARGDTSAVQHLYGRILALEPTLVEFYTDAASFFTSRNDLRAAADAYRQAVDRNPRHVAARVSLGSMLGRLKDYAGAEAELRRALEQRPDDLRALLLLGNVLILCDPRAAEQEYRRAIAAHPDAAQPWFLLGESLRKQGDDAAAAAAYDAALERDPQHRRAAAARREIGAAIKGRSS